MENIIGNYSNSHSGSLDFTLKILQEQKIKSFLTSGQILTKLTRHEGKREILQLFLSPNLKRLTYVPPYSQRKLQTLSMSDIQNIISGKGNFDKDIVDEEDKCFSIVVSNKSYNFIASDRYSRDLWVEGLLFAKTGNLDVKESEAQIEEQSKLNREKQQIANTQRIQQLEDKLKESEKTIEDLTAQIQKHVKIYNVNAQEIKSLNRQIEFHQESIHKLKLDNEKMLDQLHLLDKNVVNNKIQAVEDKYKASKQSYLELDAEYREFKTQIKDIFKLTVIEQTQSSHDSLELLSNYIQSLKTRTEYLEKELSIWLSYAYIYTLQLYQHHKSVHDPSLKNVLKFCLRRLEDDHLSVSDGNRLYSIISDSLYKLHKK